MEPKVLAVLSGSVVAGCTEWRNSDVGLLISTPWRSAYDYVYAHWHPKEKHPILCNAYLTGSKGGSRVAVCYFYDYKDTQETWARVCHLVLPWLLR